MGYQQSNGTYADVDSVILFPSTNRGASENSAAVETDRGTVSLTLDITAASGTTPTLDVSVETRKDANDTWRQVGAFSQQTGVATVRKSFAALDRQVRGVSVPGGTTPNFTFSLVGDLR